MSERVLLDDIWLTLYGREVVPDASTTCFGRKGSAPTICTPPRCAMRQKGRCRW